MSWLSDFTSDPLGTLGDTGQKVLDNPIPAITAYATGNPAALLAYASPSGSSNYNNMLSGAVSQAGAARQGLVSKAAAEEAANKMRQAGNMAQFRPVGVTNTFGSSNFQFDPTTGRLTGAGYSLSPELQNYQNAVMAGNRQALGDVSNIQNLGRQYIAQSPQEAAQQWMKNQQALLAPTREQSWANLANQQQNTGTAGLSVAQGGGLQMANPQAAALANAQAMQDLQLAANAQQAGQQQTAFGQGLLNSAYSPLTAGLSTAATIEGLGQQPLTLGTGLGTAANTGAIYGSNLYGKAAGIGLLPEMQFDTRAEMMKSASNPTSNIGGLFGALAGAGGLSSLFGGSSKPWNLSTAGGGNADINTAMDGLGEWWNPTNTTGTGDFGLVW